MLDLLREHGLGIEQLEVRVRPGTDLEEGLQHAIVLAVSERANVVLRIQDRTFHVGFEQLLQTVPEFAQRRQPSAAEADEEDFDPALLGQDVCIPLSGPG